MNDNTNPKDTSLLSEVELNADLIRIGDVLFYVDSHNSERWEVIMHIANGFTARSDYEIKDFIFSELQIGWSISISTKRKHIESENFVYKTIS